MPLSAQAIAAFKALYAECYGTALSDEEAVSVAGRLLAFVAVIARSPQKEARTVAGSNIVPVDSQAPPG